MGNQREDPNGPYDKCPVPDPETHVTYDKDLVGDPSLKTRGTGSDLLV